MPKMEKNSKCSIFKYVFEHVDYLNIGCQNKNKFMSDAYDSCHTLRFIHH